jgi:hypothetical protein
VTPALLAPGAKRVAKAGIDLRLDITLGHGRRRNHAIRSTVRGSAFARRGMSMPPAVIRETAAVPHGIAIATPLRN